MTRHIPFPCPIDHPEILAIALDVMLFPARRVHYSSLVLMLADAAIDRIRTELATITSPSVQEERPALPLQAGPS